MYKIYAQLSKVELIWNVSIYLTLFCYVCIKMKHFSFSIEVFLLVIPKKFKSTTIVNKN